MGFRICVYAICHNEAKHVRRWMESMREADGIYVLDTGSTDLSCALLTELGAHVEVCSIQPWRFDTARTRALSMVPEDYDICVSTDLDEVFSPGWRKRLENAWKPNTKRARFRFVCNYRADGSEGTVIYLDRIHARRGYHWINPVHEVLSRDDHRFETQDEVVLVEGVTLAHFPDNTKSRAQYLPLLEMAVAENPLDARNMHYLGREYMYTGAWNECIQTLKTHLSLPSAVWREERSASCRYMARAQTALNDTEGAIRALFAAIAEAPDLREPYYEMAKLLIHLKDYAGAYFMAQRALSIQTRPMSYVSEDEAWSDAPVNIQEIAKKHLPRE